ncbi:MAG TPA: UTP--glucose-1-phosphate uridylyltransferase GalU [archaeon]|nr:UTP--glucose-1-phosphate uridylyltransferase GalU [archaeon]
MRVRKAVIPAAGLGTRFLPATKVQPKEMLPLVDKPMIQYNVEEIIASGITDILIITGKGKQVIEDHFDRSPELESFLRSKGKTELLAAVRAVSNNADIHYIRQKEPRGLGDAIRCAKAWVGDEPFAVLLGDDIMLSPTPVTKQLMQLAERHQCSAIAVEHVPADKVSRFGIIKPRALSEREFEVLDLVEKPAPEQAPSDLAISGRYVLTPAIFQMLETVPPGFNNEVQLTDALKALLAKEQVYALDAQCQRFDNGTKLDFLKSTVALALARPDLGPEFRAYLKSLKL